MGREGKHRKRGDGAMAGRYNAAGLAVLTRREHGAPPLGLRALRTWAWDELRIGVRDVTQWPDGTLGAVWPDGLDALTLTRAAPGVPARIFYQADRPHAREAICRELGRALLSLPPMTDAPPDGLAVLAGDADALDFAACLLVHPGDLAAALDAAPGLDGYCRVHGVSLALVSRRQALLGEWCDRAGAGLAAVVLEAVERCDWRTVTRPAAPRASGE